MTFSWAFVVDSVPFTRAVVDGQTSLGGSESAMLGLARALVAKGQKVHILATKLDDDAAGRDPWGCEWIHFDQIDAMNVFYEWDVLVGLRHVMAFSKRRKARLRILWNQDLMDVQSFGNMVMAVAWALDKSVYVSHYHRAQWEDVLPELKPIGYVTKNGFDPAHVPDPATIRKNPNRIIHISRPERGLEPLLRMWPQFKKDHPHAELHLCRYSSMYDAGGWGEVCKQFDRQVERINAEVGGITYLGELNKAQLYRAIAESAVMWYPGVPTFAETSCIASIEAQACGTPFVGSWKGALAESVPNGILVKGDAFSKEYQEDSRAAVSRLLAGCATNSPEYRRLVNDGLKHVEGYRYDVIADEWLEMVGETFADRYESNKLGVLRQLLHYDDHAAARLVAADIASDAQADAAAVKEAEEAEALCDRVIAGKEQNAEHYADRALKPLEELELGHARLVMVADKLKGCTRVLDVACGSGAFALAMAQASPTIHVTAIDYAQRNIDVATAAAETLGVADRITFLCGPVWDFEANAFSKEWQEFAKTQPPFDGLWCGEFIEHLGDTVAFVNGLEQMVTHGAPVILSCPQGPLSEFLDKDVPYNRGHVHHFGQADLVAVFGKKQGVKFEHIPWGALSPRGVECGNWLISYTATGQPTGERPFEKQILTTRPLQRLSVGMIVHNAEHEIGKCLEVLWNIADEIVVGDCGSTDRTREIAERFPPRVVKVIGVTPVHEHPQGFAGARNDVLNACSGEWFMWVDADELVVGTSALWQYLEGGVYRGYAMHQNHLQIDAPMHFDKPIRVFKRGPDIQFYGCVHEQPQMGDCNSDIVPSLEIFDTQIAHTGYLTPQVRRNKMLYRNLPLLERDQEVFPDRVLGKLLVLRDYVNLTDVDAEETGFSMTHRARGLCLKAIDLFDRWFKDPANKFHDLARPFYETALKKLQIGTEMEFALAGKRGGLQGARAKPLRFWVRGPEEMDAIIRYHTNKAMEKMAPTPLRLDPLEAVSEDESLRQTA